MKQAGGGGDGGGGGGGDGGHVLLPLPLAPPFKVPHLAALGVMFRTPRHRKLTSRFATLYYLLLWEWPIASFFSALFVFLVPTLVKKKMLPSLV